MCELHFLVHSSLPDSVTSLAALESAGINMEVQMSVL